MKRGVIATKGAAKSNAVPSMSAISGVFNAVIQNEVTETLINQCFGLALNMFSLVYW
ncbi:MAG TPA: hypothetical protein VEC08_04735 [Nitrososphaerales archaeon]|nr:hypothetical protein [Nitrososphaerales archaeon]